MAINIPAADILCNFDPDATAIPNANVRQQIGTIAVINTKANGNLPISADASSWQSVYTNTTGFLFEGQNGPWDVSSDTKLLVWQWQHNAPNRIQQDTVANGGITIRIASGTGTANYKDFYISGSDTFGGSSQLGPVPMVIDLNNTSHNASGGTFDNTDVQSYGLIQNGGIQTGTNDTWIFVQRAHIFDTAKNATNIVKFTGTSDFDDIIDAVLGTSYTNKIGSWVTKLSDTYFVPVAFQIGDTSTATNFDCTGNTIVSPSNNDVADPRFRVTLQGTRVYIVLRDNVADDADLTNSTWVWGVAAPFDFDVGNNSAITIEGTVFNGMGEMTLGSSVIGAATFSLASGSILIINGANIDGSTVTGDVELKSDTDLTDITINGDLNIVGGVWTPANLTTVAWYDPSDTGNITDTLGAVTQLDDIGSSGSLHLTLTGGTGTELTTGTRTQNSLNVLDGTESDFLGHETFPVPSSGDIAIFMVGEIDSIPSSTFASILSMNAASNDWQFASNSTTQFDGALAWDGGTAVCANGPYAGPSIYCTKFDYTDLGTASVWMDGTIDGSESYSGADKIGASQHFRAKSNRSGAFGVDGAFGEIVIVEGCSTATRQNIEGYLAHKWGTTGKLPIGHPYKSVAPSGTTITSLDVSNVTVTGNVLNDNADSPLTINATNGSSLTTTEPGTGDGQVNIVNAVVLEINGVTTDNEPTTYVRCHIEAAAGGPESVGTILLNEEAQTAVGDGTYKATELYNYISDQPVIVRARYKGYLPYKTTGVINSSGLTITAIWIVDSNYN